MTFILGVMFIISFIINILLLRLWQEDDLRLKCLTKRYQSLLRKLLNNSKEERND